MDGSFRKLGVLSSGVLVPVGFAPQVLRTLDRPWTGLVALLG